MEDFREELSNIVAGRIVDAGWERHLPYREQFALDAIYSAFEKKGYLEHTTDRDLRVVIPFSNGEKKIRIYFHNENLLRGYTPFGDEPFGSIQAFKNTLEHELQNYEREVGTDYVGKDFFDEKAEIRSELIGLFNDRMEEIAVEHKENILEPIKGGFQETNIFEKVYNYLERKTKFFELYENVKNIEVSGSPTPHYFVKEYPGNIDGFSEGYHASEGVLRDTFFGVFMYKVAKEKGYELNYGYTNKEYKPIDLIARFAENGFRMLKMQKSA